MPKKEHEKEDAGGLDSLEAEGVVSRYEVSHSRSRRSSRRCSSRRMVGGPAAEVTRATGANRCEVRRPFPSSRDAKQEALKW